MTTAEIAALLKERLKDKVLEVVETERHSHVRLAPDDSVRLDEPHYCSRCSRLAMSLGVAEWIFALTDGLVSYSAADYDEMAQLRW